MTATAAKIGYGAKFGIEGVTPDTYVVVAEVTGIKIPSMNRSAEKATHLESPEGWEEFIAGMKNLGDASFNLNWVPSHTDVMVAAFLDETGKYQIIAPNGVRLQFTGFFTAYDIGELTTSKMTAAVTIKATGKVTLLAAVV
jgi:predicted secreted protein